MVGKLMTGMVGLTTLVAAPASARPIPGRADIDAHVAAAMQATGARSLALAVVDRGRVQFVASYGLRTAAGAPLRPTNILYGASLTKAVFAYLVLRLVDERRLDLDSPIDRYLPGGLQAYTDADSIRRYGNFTDVARDPRWHQITPRILLNHASGLANISSMEPEGLLRLHFIPGSRYAYSGMGLLLLQLVLEKGLNLDMAAEAERLVFQPLGMPDTSFTWREQWSGREATGWTVTGESPGHAHQSRARAAGSMDTTIVDMARFSAALVTGEGLSPRSRHELIRPQLAITTASQFPTIQADAPATQRHRGLAVSSVLITFRGPQGAGFMKGGHNDLTGNTMICLQRGKRCVVILGPDVRGEAAFPELTRFILGDTGFPWSWEYGDMRFWRPER